MHSEIKAGQHYLLDGKTDVIVVKPVNRSKTVFSVEIPGKSIQSVEKDRLKELEIPQVEAVRD